jgi:hypothetical protein
MGKDPGSEQQSNSQAQAGAASQLVVNIFFVSANDREWIVKPIGFYYNRSERPLTGGGTEPRPEVDVKLEAERDTNAQGQGLAIVNDLSFLDILSQAIRASSEDPDIRAALNPKEDE